MTDVSHSPETSVSSLRDAALQQLVSKPTSFITIIRPENAATTVVVTSVASVVTAETTVITVTGNMPSASPLPGLNVTSQGDCGVSFLNGNDQGEETCLGSFYGPCCGILGKCGYDNNSCGAGCQPLYGLCGPVPPPDTATMDSAQTSALGAHSVYLSFIQSLYGEPTPQFSVYTVIYTSPIAQTAPGGVPVTSTKVTSTISSPIITNTPSIPATTATAPTNSTLSTNGTQTSPHISTQLSTQSSTQSSTPLPAKSSTGSSLGKLGQGGVVGISIAAVAITILLIFLQRYLRKHYSRSERPIIPAFIKSRLPRVLDLKSLRQKIPGLRTPQTGDTPQVGGKRRSVPSEDQATLAALTGSSPQEHNLAKHPPNPRPTTPPPNSNIPSQPSNSAIPARPTRQRSPKPNLTHQVPTSPSLDGSTLVNGTSRGTSSTSPQSNLRQSLSHFASPSASPQRPPRPEMRAATTSPVATIRGRTPPSELPADDPASWRAYQGPPRSPPPTGPLPPLSLSREASTGSVQDNAGNGGIV